MWVCEKECVYLREFPSGFHWTAVSSNTTNLGEFLPSAAAPLWTFVFASFFSFFLFLFFLFFGVWASPSVANLHPTHTSVLPAFQVSVFSNPTPSTRLTPSSQRSNLLVPLAPPLGLGSRFYATLLRWLRIIGVGADAGLGFNGVREDYPVREMWKCGGVDVVWL